MLTAMAAILAILIAAPLAFIGALRQGGLADVVIRIISQISLSMPVFYIGLILLITLAAGLGWFPVGGIGNGFFEDLYYLLLPALTLALSLSAILLRNLRESLIEVLHAEYVTFATAPGLSRRLVLGRHVLRNAGISTITLLGLHIGSLVGGAVITETVFAIPGVGRLMIDSIFSRDYAVVQGLTMVLAVLVSVVFLAVDTLQALLDPRVAA
jgi:peptide/nickel transport system permease protein